MNLGKKKVLAAKVLKVGKERVVFPKSRIEEIKEAITKQDIKHLHKEGAILVKETKGRRKIEKRKLRRGPGKIRKVVNKRKQEYVKLTRKLRKYILELKKQGLISGEEFKDIRKKIKNKAFRNKSHLKEQLNLKK